MQEQFQQIANRIKELREVCDYSVEALAHELGVDVATYKSYEESGVDIPISVIYALAGKFGVDTTEILTGKAPKLNTYSVVRKGEGVNIERYKGYDFESIAYKFVGRKMEPLIVNVEFISDDYVPVLVAHSGQEMNYILEGSVTLFFEKQQVVLLPGDCVYFDPTHMHGQKANGGKPAKFLTLIHE